MAKVKRKRVISRAKTIAPQKKGNTKARRKAAIIRTRTRKQLAKRPPSMTGFTGKASYSGAQITHARGVARRQTTNAYGGLVGTSKRPKSSTGKARRKGSGSVRVKAHTRAGHKVKGYTRRGR